MIKSTAKLTILYASLLGLMIACSGGTDARENSTTPVPTSAGANNPPVESPIEQSAPAIWRLQDEDTTIYLFGTVHLLTNNAKWQSDTLHTYFDSADAVYFETDDSPDAETKMATLIPQLGFFTDGKTLNDFIAEDKQVEIAGFLLSLDLAPAKIQPMRPWLANIIVNVLLLQKSGGDPEKGADKVLGKRAEAQKIPKRFFETTEEQLSIFTALSDQQSADLLVETITQYKEMPDFFNDLEMAWTTGNTDQIWALMEDSMENYDWFLEHLLIDRNERWADTLGAVMTQEEGTFFVAVGAGHLTGDKSVQHYMALKGYTATRL